MKIVINALQYRPDGSGIAVNLRELFGPFTACTRRPCQLILPKDSPPFSCGEATERVRIPFAYGQGLGRVAYQSFVMGMKYCSDSLLLTVDSKVPFLLPRSCRVMPLLTDLGIFRLPETYQGSRVLLWKLQYRYLCRRAERFLTISEFTKRELTEVFHIPPERIQVIPCAAPAYLRPVTEERELAALREKYGLSRPFVLFVGNFNPRKNLKRLIRAFDRAKESAGLPHQLIIAGGQGWKFDPEQALRGVKARESVRFIGYVPEEDMSALYAAAEAFAFPTLYEGFGIPVIEAQTCGTPVLTSNLSSLPEVAGEGALFVDPYDEKTIADGLVRLLTDAQLRRELREKGYENAKRFSWEASARKLDEIIERMVK